ncbi:type III-B CRISPR module-associated protein Cmr5 [Paenibacillus wenxiniae]|uniref:CRISPR type III-B/RAMP module-associated protein Cmr5 n=1 Tax=Paenibacillus wenxiniae TaxID=1636843 RepID=A0ABW4RN64_9BACL
MQSAQHRYAEQAYIGIQEVKKSHADLVNEYGQLCHRFPSLVLTNGLRLAYIFFAKKAASKDAKSKAYQLYLAHMGKALDIEDWEEGLGLEKRHDKVRSSVSSQTSYLHLSRNALNASVWFKRYAEAILKVEQRNDRSDLEGQI